MLILSLNQQNKIQSFCPTRLIGGTNTLPISQMLHKLVEMKTRHCCITPWLSQGHPKKETISSHLFRGAVILTAQAHLLLL